MADLSRLEVHIIHLGLLQGHGHLQSDRTGADEYDIGFYHEDAVYADAVSSPTRPSRTAADHRLTDAIDIRGEVAENLR